MSNVMSAKSSLSDTGLRHEVSGEFVNRSGERFYSIRDVSEMAPFFISVISSDNHWMFVSSTGGLTAGREAPEKALFPYVAVDKIHDSLTHTGPRTIVRVHRADGVRYWEPFNLEHRGRQKVSRNLYKSVLGDKLCFEETNHDLELVFRYTWSTSAEYGFVRDCELQNIGTGNTHVEFVDGLQNILPAGTPRFTQTNFSNLVDAYKWTELDERTGLALFTLYAGITDRAEPCESLQATTAYCLGLENLTVLLSAKQLDDFRDGLTLSPERHMRGIRGAFLVMHSENLAGSQASTWRIVLDGPQSQSDVVQLGQAIHANPSLDDLITASVSSGSDKLARIMASADAFQATAEENVSTHHYANVLFNVLRGGIVIDQYNVSAKDFRRTVRMFNQGVYDRNNELLGTLPDQLSSHELVEAVRAVGDKQLWRLALEYLPIMFGRRHGDPSRPWNEFSIHLKNDLGEELQSYQGNWRDIFQNWEALAFSYPEFVENMIAKFVNASTIDGYNPYRITNEGIDWEVEEADNPWSYIGYWGDHQIIYLLKLLELSRGFHPQKLNALLREPVFSYANVPYRIKPIDQLFDDPKATVVFDHQVARQIDACVATVGADGKLILDADGEVIQVNLLEKLIVPLLAKLGNLVIDGGIWLNTQRPEWNDANNALVGQGLSMVTLYYMRRYIRFLLDLLDGDPGSFSITMEVDRWFGDTATILAELRADLGEHSDTDALRFRSLRALGTAAAEFRQSIYGQRTLSSTCERNLDSVRDMLVDAQFIIDRSIVANKRGDGLYHSYNIAGFHDASVTVSNLYPMLEGQVAALSAGVIEADEAASVIDSLYASAIYRADQDSFMLYPDRELPGFLERNRLPEEQVQAIPLLASMLKRGDDRIVVRDAEGCLRFNANISNEGDLVEALNGIHGANDEAAVEDRDAIIDLYESVFGHSEFTGRSGSMFGFEGLGSIYWHMVAKLLLAIAENFHNALDYDVSAATLNRLGAAYYRVRSGIGFNKTPSEYGAFPTDPYSHTPKHAGARQPGMTGQVKEEVLARFAELGIRVDGGRVSIRPALLRAREFVEHTRSFRYLDVSGDWRTIELPQSSLAFTWCQVPIVYCLGDEDETGVDVELDDGSHTVFQDFRLHRDLSSDLFARNGRVRQLTATLDPAMLFAGDH